MTFSLSLRYVWISSMIFLRIDFLLILHLQLVGYHRQLPFLVPRPVGSSPRTIRCHSLLPLFVDFCFGCCCCCSFFMGSAHFDAALAFCFPFGAIVLVKLTICIQFCNALCRRTLIYNSRKKKQKYIEPRIENVTRTRCPGPLRSPTGGAFVGSFIFICFVITIFFLSSSVEEEEWGCLLCLCRLQYLRRYIRICFCWLLNAIAANLIWP